MTVIEKHKRQQREAGTPKVYLWLAELVLSLSIIFLILAFAKTELFYEIYTTLAGFTLLFFWPFAAFTAFLALLWKEYRTHTQPYKARAALHLIMSLVIICIGSFFTMMTGF